MNKKIVNPFSSTCPICKQIIADKLPDEYTEQCGIRNRIFAESANFFSGPSIAPITVGHVLIFPKFHITSIAQVDNSIQCELECFMTEIIELVRTKFGDPIVFEHGIGKGKVGGCGVDHAHLHILPIGLDMIERIILKLHKLYITEKADLIEFLKGTDKEKSYLLFGRDISHLQHIYNDNIPSQFFRKLIAKEIGKSHWDWKELFGWNDFRNTYYTLLNTKVR